MQKLLEKLRTSLQKIRSFGEFVLFSLRGTRKQIPKEKAFYKKVIIYFLGTLSLFMYFLSVVIYAIFLPLTKIQDKFLRD